MKRRNFVISTLSPLALSACGGGGGDGPTFPPFPVPPPAPVVVAAAVSGALILYRHRENVERLRAGNENVFSFRGRPQ